MGLAGWQRAEIANAIENSREGRVFPAFRVQRHQSDMQLAGSHAIDFTERAAGNPLKCMESEGESRAIIWPQATHTHTHNGLTLGVSPEVSDLLGRLCAADISGRPVRLRSRGPLLPASQQASCPVRSCFSSSSSLSPFPHSPRNSGGFESIQLASWPDELLT